MATTSTSSSSGHPHIACPRCEALLAFNGALQFLLLLFIPIVSAQRAIALAIVLLACEAPFFYTRMNKENR